MPSQPRSSDSNISYERAATLQDLKEMAMLDAAAQTPSPDLPRLARSFAQPAQKRGVGFGFDSLEAEMQAYKLEVDEESRNGNLPIVGGGDKEAKEKFVVFKDDDEACQSPAPRSPPPSALLPPSTLSTPQPNEPSPAPSSTHTTLLPIHAAVLSQLALISRERAGLLARLQALHEQEQDLLIAHADAVSFPSLSTAEAQSYTQSSPMTIPSPSNLSPQPYIKLSTSTTPSIRARTTRNALSKSSVPVLSDVTISKPNISSTTPRLPSHCTPSHVSVAKVPSSYQRPTRTSAKNMSLRKDTTKQRTASKAPSKPRTPLSLVPTPYKKNMGSKLRTSKIVPEEMCGSTSLASLEREEWDTKVEKDVYRDAGASTKVDEDRPVITSKGSAREQDKGNNAKIPGNQKMETRKFLKERASAIATTAGNRGREIDTPGTGKVDTRGVAKGRPSATPNTAGEKGNGKATPGPSKVGRLGGVTKKRTSGIPTSTRKPVSKGVKTPGREYVATEWHVPATVARKKWDF